MELIKSPFVLEKHFKQSSSSFKHLIEPIVKSKLKPTLAGTRLILLGVFFITILVLSIPDVVGDKLLYLRLLLLSKVFFTDLVRAESFHQSCNVLNQNIITCNHYLLLTGVALRGRGVTASCR